MQPILATTTPRSVLAGVADMSCMVLGVAALAGAFWLDDPLFGVVVVVPCLVVWLAGMLKENNNPLFPADLSGPSAFTRPVTLAFRVGVLVLGAVCCLVFVVLLSNHASLPELLVVLFVAASAIRFTIHDRPANNPPS